MIRMVGAFLFFKGGRKNIIKPFYHNEQAGKPGERTMRRDERNKVVLQGND